MSETSDKSLGTALSERLLTVCSGENETKHEGKLEEPEIVAAECWCLDKNLLGEQKYTHLNLKLCRLRSLAELDLPLEAKTCVSLDASVNYLETVEYLPEIGSNLRHLDLSINRIKNLTFEITQYSQLRCLMLSNNMIEEVNRVPKLQQLQVLHLDHNRIKRLKGFEKFENLQELSLKSNQIEVVEGLSRLKKLKKLDLSCNRIHNILGLSLLPSIEVLSLSHNQLSELKEVRDVILCLENLVELEVFGNPVETNDHYAMSLLQNEGIKVFDCLPIKKFHRQRIQEMKLKKNVEEIVNLTSNAYLSVIEAEKVKKDYAIRLLNQKSRDFSNSYIQYTSMLERELEQCVRYAQDLIANPEAMKNSYLASKEGIDEWHAIVQRKEREFQMHAQKEEERRQREREMKLLEQSEAKSYCEKLVEMSKYKPELWREMKRMEFAKRCKEDELHDVNAKKTENQLQADREATRRKAMAREEDILELSKTVDIKFHEVSKLKLVTGNKTPRARESSPDSEEGTTHQVEINDEVTNDPLSESKNEESNHTSENQPIPISKTLSKGRKSWFGRRKKG